jgi:hypothetical protein
MAKIKRIQSLAQQEEKYSRNVFYLRFVQVSAAKFGNPFSPLRTQPTHYFLYTNLTFYAEILTYFNFCSFFCVFMYFFCQLLYTFYSVHCSEEINKLKIETFISVI